MRTKRRSKLLPIVVIFLFIITLLIGTYITLTDLVWGYASEITEQEQAWRDLVVSTAESWLGSKEQDGSHRPIIDIYNDHTPLARGYAVQYEDEWCSTFVSTVAIQCGLTDILPTECGCESHINLFQSIDTWQEDDSYLPLPGDVIFYHWDNTCADDCTKWSDHVGIVVGTFQNWIKVIEGNHNQSVAYRYLPADGASIRGYGVPDYESFAQLHGTPQNGITATSMD